MKINTTRRAENVFGYRAEFERNKGDRAKFCAELAKGRKFFSDINQNSSRIRVSEQNLSRMSDFHKHCRQEE